MTEDGQTARRPDGQTASRATPASPAIPGGRRCRLSWIGRRRECSPIAPLSVRRRRPHRQSPRCATTLTETIYGWLDGDELIAVYGLRKAGLSYELPWLAVAPSWRGQRYGRSALVDALRRCGRKPMTVEADESGKGWFEGIGFRTVGRRSCCGRRVPLPDGLVRAASASRGGVRSALGEKSRGRGVEKW